MFINSTEYILSFNYRLDFKTNGYFLNAIKKNQGVYQVEHCQTSNYFFIVGFVIDFEIIVIIFELFDSFQTTII